MITPQHVKERLSLAHLHALSGRAGVNIAGPRSHDYGVDVTLHPLVARGKRLVESGFPVDFQLKATTTWEYEGDKVVYDLEAKNYNDLVTRPLDAIPLVLVILCLDPDDSTWIQFSEASSILTRCCYWYRPTGLPESKNKATVRIRIPRSNLLTSESLKTLMGQLRVQK